MDRNVCSYVAFELAKDPTVEEGGKYIGYVKRGSDPSLRPYSLEPEALAFVVTDFLPSGPNAVRTAVELHPDGAYQEALFRQLESVDPEIEHLGTWHSHHCNGLPRLSEGDVAGYLRTVRRPEYRLEFFLASLVTRIPSSVDESGWIRHFLFGRSLEGFAEVSQSVRLIDSPTRHAVLTGHKPSSLEGTPSSARRDGSDANRGEGAAAWYERAAGQRLLAEGRRLLDESCDGGIVAKRRGGQITMTGNRGRAKISVTHEGEHESSEVMLVVVTDEATVLRMTTTLRFRGVALAAAFAAADRVA